MPKRDMKEDMKMQWKGHDYEHWHKHWCWKCRKGLGGVYGLGVIGAAIYYLQLSTGFWEGVLGILKALVWPAFVVYKLLGI